jgi:hypothetical protein
VQEEVLGCPPHGRVVSGHPEFFDQLTNDAVRFELVVIISRTRMRAASTSVSPRAVVLLFPKQRFYLI